MAYQWGPIWWPGLYDSWTNWPSIKILILIMTYLIFRFWSASHPRIFYSKKRLDGKIAIVTGATSGIGKETTKEFVRRGCRVIMACRDVKKAEAVREEILGLYKHAQLAIEHLDLASYASVRAFAKRIVETEEKIDILVHNAAHFGFYTSEESKDDQELTMTVNFFSPYLLTHLLINLLIKSEDARILLLTAGGYSFGNLDLKNLNAVSKLPFKLYFDSKLALMCFGHELARRLKTTSVSVHFVNPGSTKTALYRNIPGIFEALGFRWWRNYYYNKPNEGCQSVLYAAISDDLKDRTACYVLYNRCEKISPKVLDNEFNSGVFSAARKIVNLRPLEPKIL